MHLHYCRAMTWFSSAEIVSFKGSLKTAVHEVHNMNHELRSPQIHLFRDNDYSTSQKQDNTCNLLQTGKCYKTGSPPRATRYHWNTYSEINSTPTFLSHFERERLTWNYKFDILKNLERNFFADIKFPHPNNYGGAWLHYLFYPKKQFLGSLDV